MADENNHDKTPANASAFEKLILRIRWVFLLTVLVLLGIAFGSHLEAKKSSGESRLSAVEEQLLRLRKLPTDVGQMVKDIDALIDTQIEPEKVRPDEPNLYVVGEDVVPVPDKFKYLYSQFHRDSDSFSVSLMRLSTGEVLHRWEWNWDTLAPIYHTWLTRHMKHYPTFHDYWDTLPRMPLGTPTILEGNRLVAQVGRTLCCFSAEGDLLWAAEDIKHHSIEVDHEGHLWMCTVVADEKLPYREDQLVRLHNETGQVLFRKSMKEIFEANPRFDFSHHNRKAEDVYHLNDIQPVLEDRKHFRQGDLFISLRDIHCVLQYRPSTDEILWSNATYWSSQHDVSIIDDSTIGVFDNNVFHVRGAGSQFHRGKYNRFVTYNFETDQYDVLFADVFEKTNCQTKTQGRVRYFKEDDILYIEPGDQDFFVVSDLANGTDYKCIIPGNSEGKMGRTFWFRLVE
ncbi:hypothetical protein Pan97_35430 [Bremerella volcania]|uniref:Arylsulfotransferase (ASST) n=1 Tax=Bremerella volcania TaxID=2527984 RepID=A0A518CB84_9BACT|nr:arylsulfotransferase family protein [Bremerella volcania]QDU76493.1 hypothetical protein Pan97_35430 [Bremerella volcania]